MDLEIINPINKQTGSFIFLHGATRSGIWQKQMFLDLLGEKACFNHIKIIFPTAPVKYHSTTERETNIWFDTKKSTAESGIPHVDLLEIDESALSIEKIISQEQKNGIPINRILIGGISQGAIVALHGVCRFYPEVAGCIAASSALLFEEKVFEAIRKRGNNPSIFMTHGVKDEIIPVQFARTAYEGLKNVGVAVELHEFPDAEHELTKEELELIFKQVLLLVPEE